MTDFISQATLDDNFETPKDFLSHEQFAHSLLEITSDMPGGSIIALQGPWGRGKTDVLCRVASLAQRGLDVNHPNANLLRPLWINPWQYGTPDLLTPLVLELLNRIPASKRKLNGAALRRAAESLVRAGTSFGLKATAMSVPGAQLLDVAAKPIDEMLKGLFSASFLQKKSAPDRDPVAMMAQRFCELVDRILENIDGDRQQRLLICVDDLDRCLPHRQVALLEALRFLGSAGAATTIIVALDPTLARQAVVTHYGTDVFDPDLYLDKMFHLRVNLPAMSPAAVKVLIRKELAGPTLSGDKTLTLGDWLTGQPSPHPIQGIPAEWDWPFTPSWASWPPGFPLDVSLRDEHIADIISDTLQVQELRSPRLITRMIKRFHILARCELLPALGKPMEPPLWMSTPKHLKLFILWVAMGERWPTIRSAMQAIGPRELWGDRLREIFLRYCPPDQESDSHTEKTRKLAQNQAAVIEQLPNPNSATGLRQCLLLAWRLYNSDALSSGLKQSTNPIPEAFDNSLRCEGLAEYWAECDNTLTETGL